MAVLTFSSKTLINLSLPGVKTEKLTIGSISHIIEGVGVVEAIGISSIYSLNNSVVKNVYKKSGEWCDRGELIARFKSTKWDNIIIKNIGLSKEDLANKILDSELILNYDEINLEEENLIYQIEKYNDFNYLFESGFTSKYELDQLEDRIKQNKFKIKLLYNNLENKKAALREEILQTLIYSDIPGKITNINISEGLFHIRNSPLFSIKSENTKYFFRVELPIKTGSILKVGDKLKLSFTNSDRKSEKITYLKSEERDGKNNYIFSFEDNFAGTVGEVGEIYYKKLMNSEGLLIPLTSLRQERNNYYVWKIEHINGSIGDSYRINKQNINIIKKGIYYASAIGDLEASDRVVVFSDSILKDYDQVYINE